MILADLCLRSSLFLMVTVMLSSSEESIWGLLFLLVSWVILVSCSSGLCLLGFVLDVLGWGVALSFAAC